MGAVVGLATALALLAAVDHNYYILFALTLIPGLIAAGLIAFVVKEKERMLVPHVSLALFTLGAFMVWRLKPHSKVSQM